MRMYAVADVLYIYPLLSDVGKAVFNKSRTSLSGLQVIRCINHSQERIDEMFAPGVDSAEVLSNCTLLDMDEATALMDTAAWSAFVVEPGEM